MPQGKFIVIEGLDGAGTTTQVGLLVEYLRSKKLEVYPTREPTDNVIGGLIRGALSGVYKLPDSSLQLLFSADRGHHLERVIEPLIAKGSIVVSDRYFWSTVAFGSLTLDKEWLMMLQRYFRVPDLTVILKVDPEECIKRLKEDRYDFELFEEEKKLKKVQSVYIWLAKKYPSKIKVVNGNLKKEKVFENIKTYLKRLLNLKD